MQSRKNQVGFTFSKKIEKEKSTFPYLSISKLGCPRNSQLLIILMRNLIFSAQRADVAWILPVYSVHSKTKCRPSFSPNNSLTLLQQGSVISYPVLCSHCGKSLSNKEESPISYFSSSSHLAFSLFPCKSFENIRWS